MIHPQARPEPDGHHTTSTGAADRSQLVDPDGAATVPRQATGHHPDAYDLYAQIYALRTDLPAGTAD